MANPNRQLTSRRQVSSLPAGCVFALMTLEAAPTPCSRTGFHISNSSLCAALVVTAPVGIPECGFGPVVMQATGPEAPEQVGSMMIRSPGCAASIALWMEALAATCVGALPPIVTVTVSIDLLPFAALMNNWPHSANDPWYCACCCTAQAGTPPGTVRTMVVSFQVVMLAAGTLTPPMVTVPLVLPKP